MSTSAEESLSLRVFQNELRKIKTATLKAMRDAGLDTGTEKGPLWKSLSSREACRLEFSQQ